jgi:hypothetical protein
MQRNDGRTFSPPQLYVASFLAYASKAGLGQGADLDVRVIDEDGVMIRHLELDPSVDYQRQGRDIV